MDNQYITCEITGKSFSSLRGFLNHLRTLKLTSREYYDRYLKTPGEGICPCGRETKYNKFKYNTFCGYDCPVASEKRRQAVMKKFTGEDREEKLSAFKNKRIGFDPNIKKRQETLKQKACSLGMTLEEYYSQHSKRIQSGISEDRRTEITEKAMVTKSSTGNFGGRSYYKEYSLHGKKVKVQGYEPLVLDYIQSITRECEVSVSDCLKTIPRFRYNAKDCEGTVKQRLYYPDAKLKNFLVEVKSTYTFNKHRENVFEKIGGVFDANESIIIVIPSTEESRKGRLEGTKILLDWAISSQASKEEQPFVAFYDEGSTTIQIGVESSDSKCRGSSRVLEERDIVWSSVKAEAVLNTGEE